MAQGLHRAHKDRLIHRDVKPDNILVTPDGTAKLADLGLVKEVETDLNLTRTGRGLGGVSGQPLLGLYQGVPLTRRGSGYNGALPDKITVYRGPLERLYGYDPEQLRAQIRHVVLHE